MIGWWKSRQGPKVPLVYQSSVAECGAACLAMLLNFYGRRTSLAECDQCLGIGRDGVSAATLVKVGQQFGLKAKVLSVETAWLRYTPLPAILHMDFNHFVVAEQFGEDGIRVADPGKGRHWISFANFNKRFTGVVLQFEPGPDFSTEPPKKTSLGVMFVSRLLRVPRVAGYLAQLMGAACLYQLLFLALPLALMWVVDRVALHHSPALLTWIGWGVVCFLLARLALLQLRWKLQTYLYVSLEQHWTSDFFSHLLTLPFSFFQLRNRSALIQQMLGGQKLLYTCCVESLVLFFDALSVLVFAVFMIWFSPVLGGIVLLAAMLKLAWGALQFRTLNLLQQQEADAADESRYFLVQALTQIESIKILGAEQHIFSVWTNLLRKHLNTLVSARQSQGREKLWLSAIDQVTPVLVFWLGMQQLLAGTLSGGKLLAVTLLTVVVLTPLTEMARQFQMLRDLWATLYRINDTLQAEPERKSELSSQAEQEPLTGRIELQNVSFRYTDTSPYVFEDISLQIEPGQKVALIGPSGVGKSTLLHLLLGFYTPSQGQILFDGKCLTQLDLASVRRQLGVVLQDAKVFPWTIRRNIAVGDPYLSLRQIRKAAQLALIDDDIMKMPQQYKTFAGESGCHLSGGQQQRLLLARALVHNPSILILDESTSQLDVLTEHTLMSQLDALQTTQIIVTHRLQTIQQVDQIFVFHQGRLAEQGTHEELLAKRGQYWEMMHQHESSRSTT